MGDPSNILYVPASSATVPIDWTRVPEASKKALLEGYGYNWEGVQMPLPATIGDLAKMFDEKKFFGYYRPELCTLLMDISEFGLQTAPGPGKQPGPRFYMTYIEEVWFLLFAPGTRDCISGYSEKVEWKTYDGDDPDEEGFFDDDEMERVQAEKLAMAQKFDVKLEREVKRGADVMVDITHKLAGWDATMMQGDLQFSQYASAILTLPRSHPANQGLMQSVMSSIRRST
jgi:hypothetical protein